MGLVTVLYVFVKVSLFLPQCVEVRAFSILIVFSALYLKVLICSLNVSLGSKVSPSILGLRIVGNVCCPVLVIVHLYILLGLG